MIYNPYLWNLLQLWWCYMVLPVISFKSGVTALNEEVFGFDFSWHFTTIPPKENWLSSLYYLFGWYLTIFLLKIPYIHGEIITKLRYHIVWNCDILQNQHEWQHFPMVQTATLFIFADEPTYIYNHTYFNNSWWKQCNSRRICQRHMLSYMWFWALWEDQQRQLFTIANRVIRTIH